MAARYRYDLLIGGTRALLYRLRSRGRREELVCGVCYEPFDQHRTYSHSCDKCYVSAHGSCCAYSDWKRGIIVCIECMRNGEL